jgi:F-type H+-transporting ATPase subunit delta
VLEPVAKRYATALFEIALAENRIEEYDKEAEMLVEVFADRQLSDLLKSPNVTVQRKKELLEKVFAGKIQPNLMKLLKLLVDKHRIGHLRPILRYFDLLTDRHRGVEEVTITSAVPLSDEQQKQIVAGLQRFSHFGDLRVRAVVDKELLGGVVVRLGQNTVVDGSLRTRLKQMRERLYRFRHKGTGA